VRTVDTRWPMARRTRRDLQWTGRRFLAAGWLICVLIGANWGRRGSKGWFSAVRHSAGCRVELGLAIFLGALAADHVVGTARARPAAAAQQ
jgi:hypothetical protein